MSDTKTHTEVTHERERDRTQLGLADPGPAFFLVAVTSSCHNKPKIKMAEDDSDFSVAATSNAAWDPVYSNWDKENVTPQCVLRIKR